MSQESLPPPLSCSGDGPESFTARSVRERLPEILDKLLHSWDESRKSGGNTPPVSTFVVKTVRQAVIGLRDGIQRGSVVPLLSDPQFNLRTLLERQRSEEERTAHSGGSEGSEVVDAEDSSDDPFCWRKLLRPEGVPVSGCTWHSLPWLVIEVYTYHVLNGLSGFLLDPSECETDDLYRRFGVKPRVDPFWFMKRDDLAGNAKAIEATTPLLQKLFSSDSRDTRLVDPAELRSVLELSLWGNRADLSLSPGGSGGRESITLGNSNIRDNTTLASGEEGGSRLLIDDTDEICRRIAAMLAAPDQAADDDRPEAMPSSRVHIVLDNAGFELFSDLVLAHYLASRLGLNVTLWCKEFPTFVSDAVREDITSLLAWLREADAESSQSSGRRQNGDPTGELAKLSERTQSLLDSGQIALAESPWFNAAAPLFSSSELLLSGHDYYSAPIEAIQRPGNVVIVKGDANYRRVHGDLKWDHCADTRKLAVEKLGQNLSASATVLLRTCKSGVFSGGSPDILRRVEKEDPEWIANGKWGLIQCL
jgi:Damage-control phosphatase ARMT1-like domain